MKQTKQLATLALGALLFAAPLFLTNCKKDKKTEEEPTPAPAPAPAPTNTQKLTGKNFKITAVTIDPALFGVTDLYAQFEDCEKDNLIRFDTPNIYKEDVGAVKCDPMENQTSTGTWSWNSTETILSIVQGTNTVDYTVIVNDGNTLKGTTKINDGTINYVITTTMVKQ